jgi:hypothetical protein
VLVIVVKRQVRVLIGAKYAMEKLTALMVGTMKSYVGN